LNHRTIYNARAAGVSSAFGLSLQNLYFHYRRQPAYALTRFGEAGSPESAKLTRGHHSI